MNEQEALDIVGFSIEVERFTNSPIGKYLTALAEIDRNKAIEEMKTIDPADQAAVRRVQNNLCVPDRVIKWLTDAIQSGYAVEEALRASEAENGELP